ncbi:hypothetical protein ACFQV4_28390 [Streptomyces thermocarboxydus]
MVPSNSSRDTPSSSSASSSPDHRSSSRFHSTIPTATACARGAGSRTLTGWSSYSMPYATASRPYGPAAARVLGEALLHLPPGPAQRLPHLLLTGRIPRRGVQHREDAHRLAADPHRLIGVRERVRQGRRELGKRSIVARSSGRYCVSPLRNASHIGSAPLTGIRHHGFSSERGTPDITHSTSDLRSRDRRYTAPPYPPVSRTAATTTSASASSIRASPRPVRFSSASSTGPPGRFPRGAAAAPPM